MDFSKLNSATYYGSIDTHHRLGQRGMLTDELGPFAGVNPQEIVYLREKIDGANSRIVFFNGVDYAIGSREKLLYAKGDRLTEQPMPELTSIVETLKPIAENMISTWKVESRESAEFGSHSIMVLYFETYGGKVGKAAPQYSGVGNLGARLFDYALVEREVLDMSHIQISNWRNNGPGATFGDTQDLASVARDYGLPVVPNIGAVRMEELPKDLGGMLDFLQRNVGTTHALLDDEGKGEPEGIVLRTNDRSVISKARFQDYRRTLRQRGQK